MCSSRLHLRAIVTVASTFFLALAKTALYAQSIAPVAIIEQAQPNDLFGLAVASDADTLFVGAPAADNLAGAVHLFYRQGDDFTTWVKHAILRPTYPQPLRLFGSTLAYDRSGGTIAISVNDGPVFVFERDLFSRDYVQRAILAVSGDTEFQQGSMSVSANTIAVGVNIDGPGEAGSVHVFERSATGWAFSTKLQASDPQDGALFGSSVTLLGDYLAVGAPGAANAAGAVYFFERVNGIWIQRQKISAPDPEPNAWFGTSIATNIGQLIIGAPGDGYDSDTSGRVFLYEWNGLVSPTYQFAHELVPDDPLPPRARFGMGIAIDGNNRDIVVTQLPVASTVDIQEPGSAHVFTLRLNGWQQRLKLAPTASSPPSAFGASLAAASVHAVIGDYGTTSKPGAAYVYDLRLPPTPPVFLAAPEDQPLDAAPGESVEATFKATVADEDGNDLFVHWEVDGIEIERDFVDSSGMFTRDTVTLTTTLAPGTHQIRIRAIESGTTTETVHTFTVRVGDAEGPVIRSITARPSVISAQGGRFVLVRLKVDAFDSSGVVRWKITEVVSSDPPTMRPRRTLPDWKILKPRQQTVMVRAATADPQHDRTYTIHVEAIDAFDNTSQGETQVTVTGGGKKKGRR